MKCQVGFSLVRKYVDRGSCVLLFYNIAMAYVKTGQLTAPSLPLSLSLFLSLLQVRGASRMQLHSEEVADFQVRLKAAQASGDSDKLAQVGGEFRDFMKAKRLPSPFVFLRNILIQMPLFIGTFVALRGLASEAHLIPGFSPAVAAASSALGAAGGAAAVSTATAASATASAAAATATAAASALPSAVWFSSLHLPDPTFILPITSLSLSAISILSNPNMMGIPQAELTPGGQRLLLLTLGGVFGYVAVSMPAVSRREHEGAICVESQC